MTTTWDSTEPPAPPPPFDTRAKLRAARRILPLALFLILCLVLLLLVRLIEAPLCGARRPVSPVFQGLVCRAFFRLSGIGLKITGTPMRHAGALVANHSSWLDIFSLSAAAPVFFVSKAEVRSWPGIGPLARATGTVFINRKRGEARAQQEMFLERLRAGQRLLFFPEGTSTDGKRVLPFKTTLFAAFFAPELRALTHIQPVSVLYRAPEGAEPRFYGWWGDMEFGAHFLKVFGARRQGGVEVIYHPPLAVSDFPDRKALAAECEARVRGGMPWDWQKNS